jgi:hypothetical protein
MGTITRSFANNLTTGGVLKADAFNNASLNNVTALNAAIATGNMILLSSQTASSSASISFTTGIDSTYKEYQFWFINMHPATDAVNFTFQVDTGTNTSYNQTMTTTAFNAIHFEDDTKDLVIFQFKDKLPWTIHNGISRTRVTNKDEKIHLMFTDKIKPKKKEYKKAPLPKFELN